MKVMETPMRISRIGGRFVASIVLLGALLWSVQPSIAGGVGPKEWTPGDLIQGGTLTSPSTVTIGVGGSVNCEVAASSDTDHWVKHRIDDNSIDSQGDEPDTTHYAWSDNGAIGVFDDATSASTQWTAPQSPGTYTLTCVTDDAPATVTLPETGERDDDPIYTLDITVYVIGGDFNYDGTQDLRYYCGSQPAITPDTNNAEAQQQPSGTTWQWLTSEELTAEEEAIPGIATIARAAIVPIAGTSTANGEESGWVQIKFMLNGVTAYSPKHYGWTVYKPNTLRYLSTQHFQSVNNLGQPGFRTEINYQAVNQFGDDMVEAFSISEGFGTWHSDYTGENWLETQEQGGPTSDGTVTDRIFAFDDGTRIPPVEFGPLTPLGTVKVQNAPQMIYLGRPGLSSGGCIVKITTQQVYTDHGAHE